MSIAPEQPDPASPALPEAAAGEELGELGMQRLPTIGACQLTALLAGTFLDGKEEGIPHLAILPPGIFIDPAILGLLSQNYAARLSTDWGLDLCT